MKIDTKNLVSITDANQNFSKVVKSVEQNGDVIILKNNKPKYVISKIEKSEGENELITIVANMILTEHEKAFKELAKWLNLTKKKFCFCNNL